MSKSKAVFRRADPPAVDRRDYQWEKVAKRLRSHPNEWYVVQEDLPTSTAGAIPRGKILALHPDRGFEVRTEGNSRPEGGSRMTKLLYARYVPEKDTSRKNGAKR